MSILTPTITGGSLAGGEPLRAGRFVGSLWRRIVAAIVDGLIVGVAAFLIGIPLFDVFSRLGIWGPVVGFFMALPYYAILNSKIGGGQTLGKRLMHLQVVDAVGNPISFGKSLLRYGILAGAYAFGKLPLSATRTPGIIFTLISITVSVAIGATMYLIVFNRPRRQGVHDLAVGSFVADADMIGPMELRPTWKMHWVILGGLAILLFVSGKLVENRLEKWGQMPQLLADVRLVEGMAGVQNAGVQDLSSKNYSSGVTKKFLIVNAFWTGKSSDGEAFADKVAKLILQNDPQAQDHDVLRVVVIRGYDLGIARAQQRDPFERTPAEWKARVF
jgi:uncharacterized RDD family membrane protein YckC